MELTEEQKQLLEDFRSGDPYRQLKAWEKTSEDKEFLIYAYRNQYLKLDVTSDEGRAACIRREAERLLESNFSDENYSCFTGLLYELTTFLKKEGLSHELKTRCFENVQTLCEHPGMNDFIFRNFKDRFRHHLPGYVKELVENPEVPNSIKEHLQNAMKYQTEKDAELTEIIRKRLTGLTNEKENG
jgi:hypothetical protein